MPLVKIIHVILSWMALAVSWCQDIIQCGS